MTMRSPTRAEFYQFVTRQMTIADRDTGEALPRVARLAVGFGRYLGLDQDAVDELEGAAYLHDFGKMFVPLTVLQHPGKLDTHQWVLMRLHVMHGWELLNGLEFLGNVPLLVLRHHERWDGTGYPDHLSEHEIPYLARVTSLVDIWDALISRRPYKRAYSKEEAIAILREETDMGKHDPILVERFIEFLEFWS